MTEFERLGERVADGLGGISDERYDSVRLHFLEQAPKRAKRGQAEQPDDNTRVIGEARDPGDKSLLWLAWTGRLTKGNNAGALFAKLITRDGRKFLWKPAKQVSILRRFEMPLPLAGLLTQLETA